MCPEIMNQNPLEVELTDDERQPCEVWTRVMGYHRPTSSFNIGKQGEHSERKYFVETGKLDTEVSRSVH
ncbi:anaerobic ribonucleoside-triphosphate reductase [Acidithiobacillus sp.]|uniref:anaerobic ribonucleoside-triphosphate reductase n=1 Tax=Acidithiobacillus sp. TaxID=1872118 RepID=UPI0025C5D56B|nr:anaerobic ribonucleoside-triphosphate reductase [Acidithiobacillus sp.]